ncbi:MAG: Imm17 family immunity protein [Bacteroidota bacterium]
MQVKVAIILIFITGSVVLIGALTNWKVMFDNKKANFFTSRFGKNADRIAYAIIGILIILMGVYAVYSGKMDAKVE